MASGRRSLGPWWVLAWVLGAASCADIVGLTGEYSEGEPPGGAGDAGQGGSDGGGGSRTGGTSAGGHAGRDGTGGSSAGGAGGAGEAGTGGTGGSETGGSNTGGGAGAGDGGTGGAGTGGDGGSGGGTLDPPSCQGGLRTCGPDGESDCCATLIVPGGTFNRINDPAAEARVHSFRLDTYEVTVARFRNFVAAFSAGYRPNEGDGSNPNNPEDPGWQAEFTDRLPVDAIALRSKLDCSDDFATWTDDPAGNETRPITCVDWYVSGAFCIWDGGRLPTEAEWNYAAAGGSEQRVYPWSEPPGSDVIGEDHASYMVYPPTYCGGDRMSGCTLTDLIPAGTRPAGNGRFGHADLAGNVYEWVQDLFAAYSTPCDDCANLTEGVDRVIRGACFINYSALLRTDFRLNWPPDAADAGVGIRCARLP